MLDLNSEIHLWFCYNDNIYNSKLLEQYKNLLNHEERDQQKRFHFAKHRHQYLLTRAMVRSVLSLYADDIKPEKWEFKKNDYGKPFISNSPLKIPLHFNISHTDGLIVMAVSLNHNIGVDIEYLPRPGKMLDIASSFFSPSEVKELFELPVEKQRNRFFDLWTLKEAYIKACGMGLSIPLNHFSYSFSSQGKISIGFAPERNDQPELWQFWQIHPNTNYKISMALKGNIVGTTYSITMREIAPLLEIKNVDYPISHGNIISIQPQTDD